jgi:hypothetical protein
MPRNPWREDTDLPEPRDSIAEMFGLPTGQWRAPQDFPLPAPARSSRLQAVLSWLWQTMLDGFAAYAFAIYPFFDDASDRSEPAEQAIVAPAEQSPWQFETLVRQRPCAEEGGQASP